MGEPAIQSLKPILVLNIILASVFFAGGYALAYFTAPRVVERIVEKQPIVYNQTRVIYVNNTFNYTIPIENHTVIVINDTRIINNTVIINGTRTWIIGIPATNFTVSLFFANITENVSLVFVDASGRLFNVEIYLYGTSPFNATLLRDVTLELQVYELTIASERELNATVVLAMAEGLYSGGWCISIRPGGDTLGFFDMKNPLRLSVSPLLDVYLVSFAFEIGYIYLC